VGLGAVLKILTVSGKSFRQRVSLEFLEAEMFIEGFAETLDEKEATESGSVASLVFEEQETWTRERNSS
jgi:hypothetical protein